MTYPSQQHITAFTVTRPIRHLAIQVTTRGGYDLTILVATKMELRSLHFLLMVKEIIVWRERDRREWRKYGVLYLLGK
ncbi:hypothetical protein SESBI_17670 [Sesbania bispinosa]|nr:hypothetical protein SESBI_17670 [Sesbania bispinosa]